MDFQHFTCASPKMWQPTPKQQFKEKTMRNSEETARISQACFHCSATVAATETADALEKRRLLQNKVASRLEEGWAARNPP